jgi:hypothetical protein
LSSHIERNAAAHQAHEDAEADFEAALDSVRGRAHAELSVTFMLALNEAGGESPVPLPDRWESGKWQIRHEPVDHAMVDLLIEDASVLAMLMKAMETCDTKDIRALKVCAALAFANRRAPGMAEFDMQHAGGLRE